jgi:uncharacterized protein YcfL
MKNFIFFACILFFVVSCNTKNEKTGTMGSDSTTMADEKMAATTDNLDYPYTLETPYHDWQMGDKKHAVTVMKALKAYETNNIPESMRYFADSVELRFDNYHQKLSRDSLATLFAAGRNQNANVTVRLDDWESVISKDKNEEWVTLWYRQTWTDKKGKTDSMSVINDARIINGKIAVLEEALRHYPAKK